jgi:hypothetical protein
MKQLIETIQEKQIIQTIQEGPTVEIRQEEPLVGIRAERNRLLLVTDWTQVSDSPLTQEKRDEWKVYRQALRDMFINCSTPSDVVWPNLPD